MIGNIGGVGALGLARQQPRMLWTPSNASIGASLWVSAKEAATVILSGSTVSQWSDMSGRNNHLINTVAATQPIYLATAFNGLPALSFTAAGQQFLFRSAMTNLSSSSDYFIAAAFEFRQSAQNYDVICGFRSAPNTATGGAPVLQALSGSPQIGIHNTDAQAIFIKVDVTTRLAQRIATVGRNGGNALGNGGTVTVTATGPSQANHFTTATQGWNSSTTSGFQVGGRQTGTTQFGDKYICEIVALPYNPDPLLREIIRGYLAHQWGMAARLESGHPYRFSPPMI